MTKQAKQQLRELSREIQPLQGKLEECQIYLKKFEDPHGSVKRRIVQLEIQLEKLRESYFKIYPKPIWNEQHFSIRRRK
ncbi:hypothetical protein [uncultured Clostridium sp.]|uniref:hypothetical protein n=1 Tax=uncultured Clostridium sp. TaxID=59620 RepID=UPI00260E3FEB|nr:hypothetical protein [uncultured Clostridium sp.]